jgi:hypothetical protein
MRPPERRREIVKTGLYAVAAVASVAALPIVASACGEGRSSPASGPPPQSKQLSAKDFSRASFDRSTVVDNPWLPLRPGRMLVFEGSTFEDGARVSHRLVSTVTDLVKPVAGVRNVVVWEQDWRGGVLAEAELAFFAQDKKGNVWHLGEYPAEYEDGKIVATPAWIHGIKGATAGIAMPVHPRLGAADYAQGYAPPPVNWADRAQTYKVDQRTCVPAGCYKGVLVIREFERSKPDASQLKYYGRGLGNVRVGWLGTKDQDHEVLVLTRVRKLDAKAMARVRRQALLLERYAYERSKAVYGGTAPSTRR